MIPQRKEEDMTTDGYLKGSERSHNQKKKISRDVSGGLSMGGLSAISTDRLTKSSCEDGLFVVHNKRKGVYEGKNTMATDSHSKISKRDYDGLRRENIDK